MENRKYTKTRRAEQQDETRERIVEAAVKLHEALGPANTSIKAIAEEAGVQRLTVYRHFPDDVSLFQACTAHYLGLHPPPDMARWAEVIDASERSYTALTAVYRYYRQTEKMWRAGYRDVDQLEALQGPMARFEAYLDRMSDDLVQAWNETGTTKKQLQDTLRHALRFSTWHALKNAKLTDKKIAELVQAWLAGIGKSGSGAP
jgi:AcrR family transcriptional regulator